MTRQTIEQKRAEAHTKRATLCRSLDITEREADVLFHRLGEPSAIVDVLTDDGQYDPQTVEDACDLLYKEDLRGALEVGGEQLVKDILQDCVEGGTYLNDIDDALAGGDLNKGEYVACHKAAYSLARKISAYVGKPLTYPNY